MRHNRIIFPADAKGVIDVTKAPYFADHTGRKDCTGILRQIYNDVLQEVLNNKEKTVRRLEAEPDPDARIGFENKKVDGKARVVLLEELPKQKIIYFPKGQYLVSDTICHTHRNLYNSVGKEMNQCIHFRGESRDDVIIKLKDGSDGFGMKNYYKPVISFILGDSSSIAMSNTFEDITIDVGRDNPGAVGLEFFSNNTGAVRNVRIKSSDPEYQGGVGMAFFHEQISGALIKNVEIEGFDYGIKLEPLRMYTVFENIHLSNQNKAGFSVGNAITSIHGLYSKNKVPALVCTGPKAFVALVDGELTGGIPNHYAKGYQGYAIDFEIGTIFARNIKTEGYAAPIKTGANAPVHGDYIEEYSSDKVFSLFDEQDIKSMSLPIEDTPSIPWECDLSKWVSVNSFGAKGDGKTDDTKAIQDAMNSGKAVIYFQSGRYVISHPVKVPASVERINFMYCDLIAGESLRNMKCTGTFTITGESDTPLVIEDLLAWEKYYGYMYLIHHASKRTLILSDLHTQTGVMYFNSVSGGKVYMENVACTTGSGDHMKTPDLADGGKCLRNNPCFSFKGQKVWARQINPERSLKEVLNDGSTFWLLGFKSEGSGTVFETVNNGKTEVLGGVFSMAKNSGNPAIVSHESSVSIAASSNGYSSTDYFPIAVRETRKGVTRELKSTQLPQRFAPLFNLPLYSSGK